jgi:hypothetical protein
MCLKLKRWLNAPSSKRAWGLGQFTAVAAHIVLIWCITQSSSYLPALRYRPAPWRNLTGTLRFCKVARRRQLSRKVIVVPVSVRENVDQAPFPRRTLPRKTLKSPQSPMSTLGHEQTRSKPSGTSALHTQADIGSRNVHYALLNK